MRNVGIVMFVVLAVGSSSAFAKVFNCYPAPRAPNGLNLKLVTIDMDDENPNAIVTLNYQGSSSPKSLNADTEGDDVGGYSIEYKTGHIFLKSGVAQVFDNRIDTFSVLGCQ